MEKRPIIPYSKTPEINKPITCAKNNKIKNRGVCLLQIATIKPQMAIIKPHREQNNATGVKIKNKMNKKSFKSLLYVWAHTCLWCCCFGFALFLAPFQMVLLWRWGLTHHGVKVKEGVAQHFFVSLIRSCVFIFIAFRNAFHMLFPFQTKSHF